MPYAENAANLNCNNNEWEFSGHVNCVYVCYTYCCAAGGNHNEKPRIEVMNWRTVSMVNGDHRPNTNLLISTHTKTNEWVVTSVRRNGCVCVCVVCLFVYCIHIKRVRTPLFLLSHSLCLPMCLFPRCCVCLCFVMCNIIFSYCFLLCVFK